MSSPVKKTSATSEVDGLNKLGALPEDPKYDDHVASTSPQEKGNTVENSFLKQSPLTSTVKSPSSRRKNDSSLIRKGVSPKHPSVSKALDPSLCAIEVAVTRTGTHLPPQVKIVQQANTHSPSSAYVMKVNASSPKIGDHQGIEEDSCSLSDPTLKCGPATSLLRKVKLQTKTDLKRKAVADRLQHFISKQNSILEDSSYVKGFQSGEKKVGNALEKDNVDGSSSKSHTSEHDQRIDKKQSSDRSQKCGSSKNTSKKKTRPAVDLKHVVILAKSDTDKQNSVPSGHPLPLPINASVSLTSQPSTANNKEDGDKLAKTRSGNSKDSPLFNSLPKSGYISLKKRNDALLVSTCITKIISKWSPATSKQQNVSKSESYNVQSVMVDCDKSGPGLSKNMKDKSPLDSRINYGRILSSSVSEKPTVSVSGSKTATASHSRKEGSLGGRPSKSLLLERARTPVPIMPKTVSYNTASTPLHYPQMILKDSDSKIMISKGHNLPPTSEPCSVFRPTVTQGNSNSTSTSGNSVCPGNKLFCTSLQTGQGQVPIMIVTPDINDDEDTDTEPSVETIFPQGSDTFMDNSMSSLSSPPHHVEAEEHHHAPSHVSWDVSSKETSLISDSDLFSQADATDDSLGLRIDSVFSLQTSATMEDPPVKQTEQEKGTESIPIVKEDSGTDSADSVDNTTSFKLDDSSDRKSVFSPSTDALKKLSDLLKKKKMSSDEFPPSNDGIIQTHEKTSFHHLLASALRKKNSIGSNVISHHKTVRLKQKTPSFTSVPSKPSTYNRNKLDRDSDADVLVISDDDELPTPPKEDRLLKGVIKPRSNSLLMKEILLTGVIGEGVHSMRAKKPVSIDQCETAASTLQSTSSVLPVSEPIKAKQDTSRTSFSSKSGLSEHSESILVSKNGSNGPVSFSVTKKDNSDYEHSQVINADDKMASPKRAVVKLNSPVNITSPDEQIVGHFCGKSGNDNFKQQHLALSNQVNTKRLLMNKMKHLRNKSLHGMDPLDVVKLGENEESRSSKTLPSAPVKEKDSKKQLVVALQSLVKFVKESGKNLTHGPAERFLLKVDNKHYLVKFPQSTSDVILASHIQNFSSLPPTKKVFITGNTTRKETANSHSALSNDTRPNNKTAIPRPTQRPQNQKTMRSLLMAPPSTSVPVITCASQKLFADPKSPLSHVPASSSLLPQRKRPLHVESKEKQRAKRMCLEKKYPMPPGVVIKTEPDDMHEYEKSNDAKMSGTSLTSDKDGENRQVSTNEGLDDKLTVPLVEDDKTHIEPSVDDVDRDICGDYDGPPTLIRRPEDKACGKKRRNSDDAPPPPILEPMVPTSSSLNPELPEEFSEHSIGCPDNSGSPDNCEQSDYVMDPSASSTNLPSTSHSSTSGPVLSEPSEPLVVSTSASNRRIQVLKELLKKKEMEFEHIRKMRSELPSINLDNLKF